MTVKVALAGCGNMGYAMLSGWLKSSKLRADETFVIEPNAELRARAKALGSGVSSDAGEIPTGAVPASRLPALRRRPHDVPQHRRRNSNSDVRGDTREKRADRPLHAQHTGCDRQGHDGHVRQ